MKVLVLSCGTGEGHNRAGSAVAEAFLKSGVNCVIKDPLKLVGRTRASNAVCDCYINIAKNAPRVFGRLYSAGELVSKLTTKSPIYLANCLYAEKLYEYIESEGFNAVVCPHLFPAEAITRMRKRHSTSFRHYFIATDYDCIPFTRECDADALFIPHEELALRYDGCRTAVRIPTGIPTSALFRNNTPKKQARAELHLPENATLYMIMSGSMGFGNVTSITNELTRLIGDNDNILVLTGANDALYENISRLFYADKRVRPIAYTKRVALYMDACDVLLTKPGGLSSTEAAVKNIPLVHTAPIPGCETENARFFSEHGMSVFTNSPEESAQAAVALVSSAERVAHMKFVQKKMINPLAAEDIAAYIINDVRSNGDNAC